MAGNLAWRYTTVDKDGRTVPALVVGAPATTTTGTFGVYLIFLLAGEQGSVSVVQNTLLVGGAALALALTLIAALVAAQVVRPVRRAAAVAERLAAGSLDERMPVKGAIELTSMATVVQRDGRGDQGTDPAARGVRPAATAIHLGRLPRTAHPGDDRADGRRRAAREPGGLPAASGQGHRTAGGRTRPVRGAARRPAGDQPARRGDGRVERRGDRRPHPHPHLCAGCPTVRGQRRHADQGAGARRAGDRRDRRPAVRTDPAEPARTMPSTTPTARTSRWNSAYAPDAMAITVTDHGVGLKPGEAGLVFNRFWRADPSRQRQTGGTGLGLAISLEDARLHGGWLQASGAPGKGRPVPADAADDPRHPGHRARRCRSGSRTRHRKRRSPR